MQSQTSSAVQSLSPALAASIYLTMCSHEMDQDARKECLSTELGATSSFSHKSAVESKVLDSELLFFPIQGNV